jgi:hypothetical protein
MPWARLRVLLLSLLFFHYVTEKSRWRWQPGLSFPHLEESPPFPSDHGTETNPSIQPSMLHDKDTFWKSVVRQLCLCGNKTECICLDGVGQSLNTILCHWFVFLLGFELRASHLLSRCSIAWGTLSVVFCTGYFRERVPRTICLVWLQTMIFLISASWGVQAWAIHAHLARLF